MNVRRLTRTARTALFVLPLLASSSALAQAQAPAAPKPQMGRMQVDETQATAMVAERQKMMANMRAMDQKLNELVAKMNSATGAAKGDATASVVTALVEQRATMNSQMMSMQDRMMGHMMQHMMSMQGDMTGMMGRGQAGSAPSPMNMASMMSCPLMQQLQKEAVPPAK